LGVALSGEVRENHTGRALGGNGPLMPNV
jgi:hypothetical protein